MMNNNPEDLGDIMLFFTVMFIASLLIGVIFDAKWVWALAAFFGFAAIMTQIEIY